MYRSLGGIAPASPGYATVTIAPKISKTLDPVSANASVATVRGVVSSSWTRHTAARCVDGLASLVTMQVSVPVGMLGDVHVPLRVADRPVLWRVVAVRREFEPGLRGGQ